MLKKIIFILNVISCFIIIQNCSTPAGSGGGDSPSAPYIVSTTPADGATGIDYNYHSLAITFNKAMKWGYSFNSNFSVDLEMRAGSGNTVFYIVFQSALAPNTTYSVLLNPDGHDYNFQSQDGGVLVPNTGPITFTTGGTTNQPTISSTTPANGANNVLTTISYIEVNFDQNMITGGYSYNLLDGSSNYVPNTQSWIDSNTFRIYPDDTLNSAETYTLTLNPHGSGQWFRSSSNIRLHETTSISFTTQL